MKFKLGQALLRGVLLFQLVIGQVALQAAPNDPSASQSGVFPQPLVSIEGDFDFLVESLVRQAAQRRRKGETPFVRAIHIEGQNEEPLLEKLALALAQKDIELRVFWISEEEFDRVERQLERGDSKKAGQFILFLQTQYPELAQDSGVTHTLGSRIVNTIGPKQLQAQIERLTKIKNLLFHLPKGITLVDHFVHTQGEGKPGLRYKKTWADFAVSAWGAAASATAIGWGLITTGLEMNSHQFQAIMGIVLFWEFVSTFFQKEIGSFFAQWKTASVEKNIEMTEREKRVTISRGIPNVSLLLGFTIFHETLVSYLVTSLDSGVWHQPATEWFNIGTNAMAAAFASLPILAVCAKALLKADQVKLQNPKQARRLNAVGYGLTFLYFGAIFPIFDGLQLSMGTEDIRAAIPFWTLGAVGVTYFAYTQKQKIRQIVPTRLLAPKWKLLSQQCRMLFTTSSIESRRPFEL